MSLTQPLQLPGTTDSNPASAAGVRHQHTFLASHLYGDVKHEARLSRVSHAHHPDPVGIAHTHLLWKQREIASKLQGKWMVSEANPSP